MNLIARQGEGLDISKHWQGRDTRAGRILPDEQGNHPFPTLDPWLRDLLAECMAHEWHRRPELRTVIERAEIGARMPPAAYNFPPGALARETPEYIRGVLQTLIYDADDAQSPTPSPPPPPPLPPNAQAPAAAWNQ